MPALLSTLIPKLAPLILTEAGRVSHTKTWSNIANATATAVVCKVYLAGSHTDPELLALYLAIVGSHAVASKYLSRPAPQTPAA